MKHSAKSNCKGVAQEAAAAHRVLSSCTVSQRQPEVAWERTAYAGRYARSRAKYCWVWYLVRYSSISCDITVPVVLAECATLQA